ncbi:Hpt domain-containing protein [Vibrio gazogenes]|uniref:HPt (Histidine-containing phosphotransfer) domain-containing protein n=1 Tax=Vibrio gazogenes DSM 21264 = NBRC 103151 TaxID=1123492 RepID=A0A1M5AX29_VIBGA|nr:Hpt domain-containing protein [Vibrio gazogenes]USP12743.1 Hpt domain-containing protein [Vibrio gazogenes]SHF34696.1 HPt (histidine-containing phosphotransfer) domain-containing protein [Vibrio gazogenes DSM 21264] [Vibrio gazogenes DSM 21264 = NBRC 103151]SJN57477.1 Hpt domain protein [Vibrio gazogenes]
MADLQYFQPTRVADMVGEENISEMLSGYLISLDESLSQLRSYWQDGDIQHVRMTSHRMKSSARFIGADELAEVLQQIETDSLNEADNICTQTTRLSVVEQWCHELTQEIHHYLDSAS